MWATLIDMQFKRHSNFSQRFGKLQTVFNGYRSISATANINHAVDEFDDALRSIAARDPKRVGFVDFGAWFTQRWGARRLNGVPAYRRVSIGSLQVSNTSGDGLENAWLSDGHAGTAMNALWAQYLIGRLREISGAQLTPISDEEVIRFMVNDEAPSQP